MADKVDWSKAFYIESRVADIMSRQEKRGVAFNVRQAQWYIHLLTERILRIDLEAVPQMPRVMRKGNPISKPFKKNGQYSEIFQKYLKEEPELDGLVEGPFTRVSFEDFDLSKVGEFKDWMLGQGWQPDEWNIKDLTVNSAGKKLHGDDLNRVLNGYMQDLKDSKSGKLRMKLLGIKPGMTRGDVRNLLVSKRKVPAAPKITESSLETIDTPLGKKLQQRMVWSHRLSLIRGLVERTRSNGRIGAAANPDATPTHRMKHRDVVNIPAARSTFGKESRSLFEGGKCEGAVAKVVKPQLNTETHRVIPLTNLVQEFKKGEWKTKGVYKQLRKANRYVIVGYDGAGLELRMLAHYINDPDFTREVVDGDIHTKNQLAAGLPTRDDAKTFIYAFIYGAGDAKIGSIVGGTSKDGARLRQAFLEANPKLAALIDNVKREAASGHLIGIDGRKLLMRRNEDGEVMAHKALNTLLQAAGAIVMKYAMVWLDDAVKEAGLRAWKILDIHDEGQWECHPEDVDKLKTLMSQCVRKAGEHLGLNCPLASDAVAGATWAETH